MTTMMIRKQIYLARDQDQKVKAIAAERGCSEAAVIRDALDHLASPSGTVADRLAAAGLLSEESSRPSDTGTDKLEALEDELRTWLASPTGPLCLSEAVEAERAER